ncbi:hypothetical protein D925_00021 [Enterococcus faecalis B83616-1]|uniref:hypothetical protein n=1 Tax=Enterococcus faecalis TaxID=1351 RepID=UPI000354090F|nr:hypothetical protein D925_00021 [Enterococcus faecalis B83616-1]
MTRSGQKCLTPRNKKEFRLISEGVASVPAVYQFLSLEQKFKVIFVPGSPFFFGILKPIGKWRRK